MKEERILWKALCSPEQITADERMEQLEFKGYYWGYHALLFLVYVSALLIGQCHVWMESDAMRSFFSLILLFGTLILVENGRFLYSCYHGIQEFSDPRLKKNGRGKVTFFSAGITAGVWGTLNLGFLFGWKHPLPWIASAAGCFFYWLLCHLAYFHYALVSEREEPLKGRAGKTALICGLGLVLYVAVPLVLGIQGAGYYAGNGVFWGEEKNTAAKETRELWEEIEKGRQRFGELDNRKTESAYFTDLKEGPEIYEFPDGRVTARALHWYTSGGISYERLLGPEDSGQSLWEMYWDGEEAYVAAEDTWMTERDYLNAKENTEAFLWNGPPGTMGQDPMLIADIAREFRGTDTFYTVRYKEDCGISFWGTGSEDGRRPKQATEHYTLNEFGILVSYDCEIRGLQKDGQTPYVERSSQKLLSASQKEIEAEVQSLLAQYPKT